MSLPNRTQTGSWRDLRAAWLHLHGMYANPFALGREPTAEFVDWQELTIDVGRIYSNVGNVDGPWVIYGARGRGKTALCRVLQADCFPLQPNSKRLALLVGRDSLTRLVQACEHRVMQMDAIDLVAHVLLEACSRVEHWPVLSDQENAAEQSSQLRQACDELANACAAIHARQAAQLGDIGRFSLSTDLLHRFEELLRRGGFTSFSLLIDEVSETAQLVAALGLAPLQLMTPLLAALEYRDPAWMKAVVFVPGEWKRPLEGQYLYARDKTYSKELEWNQDDLVEMLNRRLAFSTRATSRTPSFEALCDSDLRLSIYGELVAIASGRPRCALALAEQLLEEHCAVEPAQRYIARRDLAPRGSRIGPAVSWISPALNNMCAICGIN